MTIHILYENPEWLPPIEAALQDAQANYQLWDMCSGQFDLSSVPPEGIYYSRMSASADSRGHGTAPIYTQHLLNWLSLHGRKVVNGANVLALETSKVAQYSLLKAAGFNVPATRVAVGKKALLEAAKAFGQLPFIIKPNCGGKGLGVQLMDSIAALESYLASDNYAEPNDHTWLIQEYIRSPESFITRAEFINTRCYYAVRVDTSDGFELCPADTCGIEGAFCPMSGGQLTSSGQPAFVVQPNNDHPVIKQLEQFMQAQHIDVAGVEYIVDAAGKTYVYDINTNTNYNQKAEAIAGVPKAIDAVVAYLQTL